MSLAVSKHATGKINDAQAALSRWADGLFALLPLAALLMLFRMGLERRLIGCPSIASVLAISR
jgi:hypothetical protein